MVSGPVNTFRTREAFEHATEIRLTLLAMGWKPVPLCEKRPFIPEWNVTPVDEAMIRGWPMKPSRLQDNGDRVGVPAVTTGIQLEGNTFVVDVDIPDQEVAERIEDVMFEQLGELYNRLPYRHSGGAKFMVMMQSETPFDTWRTHKYSDGEDHHMVEAFGGAALARQFAVEGPHTLGDIVDGQYQVFKRYHWERETTPFMARPEDLPMVSDRDIRAMLMRIDEVLAELAEARGWEQVTRTAGEIESGGRVFDLDIEALYETQRYGDMGYEDLALLPSGERLSASGFEPGASNRSRCRTVLIERDGVMVPGVFDFEDHVTHWPPGFEGLFDRADLNVQAAALGEHLNRIADRSHDVRAAMDEIEGLDGMDDWVQESLERMLSCYVFVTAWDCFVHLDHPDQRIKRTALLTAFNQRVDYVVFNDEGEPSNKRSTIGKLFMASDFMRVKEVGFDPRQPRLYEAWDDHTARYLNAFTGLPEIGEDDEMAADLIELFMEHLIPDEVERDYFLDWLAHKYQNPQDRNCAILMLAEGVAGTGRGALFGLLSDLFGEYGSKKDESHLFEKHNKWMGRTLLVMVDELGKGNYWDKEDAYQKLKTLFDPTNNEFSMRAMQEDSIGSRTYCSGILATNKGNGVMFDAEDRRFAVVRNGRMLNDVEDEWADVFMETYRGDGRPGLMAALGSLLRNRVVKTSAKDLATPPRFEGWYHMVRTSEDLTDEAIREVVDKHNGFRVWEAKTFRKLIAMELGDREAKPSIIQKRVADLTGAKAAMVGAEYKDMVWVHDGEKRLKRAVVCNHLDAFLSMSESDRWDALSGTDLGRTLAKVTGGQEKGS